MILTKHTAFVAYISKFSRMDYMSSECSSEGDDYDLVPGEWQRLANLARTDQSGQVLEAEKVLEVKTPQWRSAEVNKCLRA